MINDEDKKKELEKKLALEFLCIEKTALSKLTKPQKIVIVEQLAAKFEEEYKKHENK